jgi:predicted DCC family thiol-disulfide oxidoreductase YuxK
MPATRLTPVLFFDGDCHLCNESVRQLLKLDRHRRLRYAPLQGETARMLFGQFDHSSSLTRALPDSIVFFDGKRLLVTWKALLGIATLLWPGVRLLLAVLSVPPISWLGAAAYRVIAALRYRIFGRAEYCAVGKKADRELFLP